VVFGTFGGAVSTFDELKKTVSARWGTHEIWQGKPILEYAGASLIELTFKMELIKPYTVDPKSAITMLQEIMDLAIPLPLIIGLFPMGRGLSLFVMESLEIELKYFFQGGGILGASANVKLKEYPNPPLINTLRAALGGGDTAPATDTAATAAPGTAAASNPTGDVLAGDLEPKVVAPEAAGAGNAPEIGPENIGVESTGPTEVPTTPSPPIDTQIFPQGGGDTTPQIPQTGVHQ
jgi:phage protein U